MEEEAHTVRGWVERHSEGVRAHIVRGWGTHNEVVGVHTVRGWVEIQ